MVEFIKSELFNVDLFNLWQLLADVLVGVSSHSIRPEAEGSLNSKLSNNIDQLNTVFFWVRIRNRKDFLQDLRR